MNDEAQTPDAPADDAAAHLQAELSDALGEHLTETGVDAAGTVIARVPLAAWRDVARRLRDAGFSYFGFLSAIDWADAPEGRYEDTEFDAGLDEDQEDQEGAQGADEAASGGTAADGVAGGATRFQLFMQLTDTAAHRSLVVKADIADDAASAPSIHDIFAGADWHERECHEMFGISFDGHPNLAHIYLPTEFEGHPLRKDFPLLARAVKPWPGVVDIEEIPEHLEEQLEADVMARFEADLAAGRVQ